MFRRLMALLILVMGSRYELLQTAGILVLYFFAVVIQDNARPYDRELVDNFEFLQLLSCHFILLLGLVHFGAGRCEQPHLRSRCPPARPTDRPTDRPRSRCALLQDFRRGDDL